jgi:hypothetical protein
MTWILIVVMSGYMSTSTVSMQEFNNQTACQDAANYIAQFNGLRRAICVQKGEKK